MDNTRHAILQGISDLKRKRKLLRYGSFSDKVGSPGGVLVMLVVMLVLVFSGFGLSHAGIFEKKLELNINPLPGSIMVNSPNEITVEADNSVARQVKLHAKLKGANYEFENLMKESGSQSGFDAGANRNIEINTYSARVSFKYEGEYELYALGSIDGKTWTKSKNKVKVSVGKNLCEYIVRNGDPSKKADFLIVVDPTAQDEKTMKDRLVMWIKTIGEISKAFKSNEKKMNIVYLKGGLNIPAGTDPCQKYKNLASQCQADVAIFYYSKSTGRRSLDSARNCIRMDVGDSDFMEMVHEVAHAFAYLDDEYIGGSIMEGKNCAKSLSDCKAKWKGIPGWDGRCFTGCATENTWRGTETSILQTPYSNEKMTFGPINEYYLRKRFEDFS
jgi:hypothetical protein